MKFQLLSWTNTVIVKAELNTKEKLGANSGTWAKFPTPCEVQKTLPKYTVNAKTLVIVVDTFLV